jgi:transposase
MARYKKYSYDQGKLIPIQFDKQIVPGTFEYTLSYLVDNEIDLSVFEQRYKNDDTGAPAYDPAILLKIVLFAYSRGVVSSRKIARCCRENVVFMALSADTRPHFTTIADFISSSSDEIPALFSEVLLICDEMKLIGKEMFAIDGCKLPSNASKEWSGTKAEFSRKKKKMERAVRRILEKHREMDKSAANEDVISADRKYVKTLRSQIRKIKKWMDDNDDKPGKSGGPIKSNITDNDSAKMKSSKGVIQGYDGIAAVDSKHQVVVHAEAFGNAQEHDLLGPMIEGCRENFQTIDSEDDVFKKTKLTADAGFHTEDNMKMLSEENIDGYVADKLFRKRDPRFAERDRYKERHRKERRKFNKTPGDMFTVEDFSFDKEMRFCICPAGKRMYRNGGNVHVKGYHAVKFRGPQKACLNCEFRSRCLRHPDRTETRQIYYFTGRRKRGQETYTQKMKHKIDSTLGRFIYSKRIGTAEPVFASIRHAIGLDRFTLRGNDKVDTQWKLYCIVHNLLKIHRYGIQFE